MTKRGFVALLAASWLLWGLSELNARHVAHYRNPETVADEFANRFWDLEHLIKPDPWGDGLTEDERHDKEVKVVNQLHTLVAEYRVQRDAEDIARGKRKPQEW